MYTNQIGALFGISSRLNTLYKCNYRDSGIYVTVMSNDAPYPKETVIFNVLLTSTFEYLANTGLWNAAPNWHETN